MFGTRQSSKANYDYNPEFQKAAAEGDIDQLESIYASGVNINQQSPDNDYTPLLDAIANNQMGTFEWLISQGAKINKQIHINQYSWISPLSKAIEVNNTDMIRALVNGVNVNELIETQSPLHQAILQNKFEAITILLENGADINLPNANGATPFHLATLEENIKLMDYLFKKGAKINQRDIKDATPIWAAATKGKLASVNWLIEHGQKFENFKNKAEYFLNITKEGHTKILDIIIRHLPEIINSANYKGDTALHIAYAELNMEQVRLLVQKGIDVNKVNDKGKSALWELFRLHHSFNNPKPYNTKIQIANYLLDHKASAKSVNQKGQNLLQVIYNTSYKQNQRMGPEEMNLFFKFIQAGADVNVNLWAFDYIDYYYSPLRFACTLNNIELNLHIINSILRQGAKIDIESFYYVIKNNLQVIERLFQEYGLPFDKSDYTTLLQKIVAEEKSASKEHLAEWVQKLISQELVDFTEKDSKGLTLLQLAINKGKPEIAKLIAEKYCDLKEKDQNFNNYLHLSVKSNALELVEFFIKIGANPNEMNDDGDSVLNLAIKLNNVEAFEYLMTKRIGLDFSITDLSGNNIFHTAVEKDNIDIFNILLANEQAKLLLDAPNKDGDTPLMLAVKRGNIAMIAKLVSEDVNFSHINNEGEDLAILAYNSKNPEILELLSPHLAIEGVEEISYNQEYYFGKNQNNYYQNPLEKAIKDNKIHKVQDVIRSNSGLLKSYNIYQQNPLHIAIKNQSHPEIVRIMLDKGADVNATDIFNNTPILTTAKYGSLEIFRILEIYQAKITTTNKNLENSLHLALKAKNMEIVKYLLEKYPELSVVNKFGEHPYDIAVKFYQHEVIKALMENASEISMETSQRIIRKAIKNKDEDILKIAIEKNFLFPCELDSDNGIDIEIRDQLIYEGFTFSNHFSIEKLEEAFKEKDHEKVKYLLPLIPKPSLDKALYDIGLYCKNAFESFGTAGFCDKKVNHERQKAIALLDHDYIKLLLENGADPNYVWYNRTTTLFYMLRILYRASDGTIAQMTEEQREIIKLLLDHGAKCYRSKYELDQDFDHKGRCIAHYTTRYHHKHESLMMDMVITNDDIVTLTSLIEEYNFDPKGGVLVPIYKWQSHTINYLMHAAKNKANECLTYLLKVTEPSFVNATNGLEETPIVFALRKNNFEGAKILLDHGANLNILKFGTKIFKALIEYCNKWYIKEEIDPLIIKFLVEQNHDEETNQSINKDLEFELIKYAIETNDIKFLNELVDKNIDPNSTNGSLYPLHIAVTENNFEAVKILIKQGAKPDVLNIYKQTPFSLSYSLQIDKYLLKHNANLLYEPEIGVGPLKSMASLSISQIKEYIPDYSITLPSGHDMLTFAAFEGNYQLIQEILAERGGVCHDEFYQKVHTPAYIAASIGHEDCLRLLLESGANPFYHTKTGHWTLLHIAAQNNHSQIVEMLVSDYNLEVDQQTKYGLSALHIAAEKGNTVTAEFLIKSGANVELETNIGKKAIHYAAEHLREDVIKTLIEMQCDINALDCNGWSPLQLAIMKYIKISKSFSRAFFKNNDLAAIGKLIEAGADLNFKIIDDDGFESKEYNLVEYAAKYKNQELLKLLNEKIPNIDEYYKDPLANADHDINFIDEDGKTKLYYIYQRPGLTDAYNHDFNDKENRIIKKLKQGANPNIIIDEGGNTPLINALTNNNNDLFYALLEAGADPNIHNLDGKNCFDVIENVIESLCSAKNLIRLRKLIKHGLEIQNNESNFNLISAAIIEKDFATAQLLLLKNYDTNKPHKDGSVPIAHAFMHNAPSHLTAKIIERIEDVNAPIKIFYKNHQVTTTILLHAIKYGSLKQVQQILSLGADPNLTNELYDLSPLQVAIKLHKNDVVELLLQEGADIKQLNSFSETVYHIAIKAKNLAVVDKLLPQNSEILNIQNHQGDSALIEAIKYGDLQLVQLLLQSQQIDLNQVNNKLQTPLHQAIINNKPNIAIFLLDHDANPDAQDIFGCSVAHYAAENGLDQIWAYMHLVKANFNLVDLFGWTPLLVSINMHQDKSFKFIMNQLQNTGDLYDSLSLIPNPKEIIQFFDNILEYKADDVNALTCKGILSISLGNNFEAERSFTQILKIDTNNIEALQFMGHLYLHEKNYIQAKECFDKILSVNPQHNKAWKSKHKILKNLLEINPDDELLKSEIAEHLIVKTKILFQTKNLSKITKYNQLILSLKPEIANEVRDGLELMKLEIFGGALDCFKIAIELLPYDKWALNLAAVNMVHENNYNESLQYIEKAILIAPNNILFLANKAIICSKMENFFIAAELFFELTAYMFKDNYEEYNQDFTPEQNLLADLSSHEFRKIILEKVNTYHSSAAKMNSERNFKIVCQNGIIETLKVLKFCSEKKEDIHNSQTITNLLERFKEEANSFKDIKQELSDISKNTNEIKLRMIYDGVDRYSDSPEIIGDSSE